MNKLDAAIHSLKISLRYLSEGRGGKDRKGTLVEIEQAIRILEAAAKMEKERLISLLDGSDLHHIATGAAADREIYVIDPEATAQLYDLLEALSDSKEKKP